MGAAKELLGVVTGQTDRVFDAQQSAIYRANFKLFRGVVYSAVMEKRTCVVCAGYDGRIYWMEKVPKGEKGETFAKKPALPIHPNCRCAYVPFCKSWEELPVDPEEFSKSARKLLGGDIPKTRKWEEWFLTRSENTQKKILGKTRFDLWKANAVDIKDLSVGSKVVPLKDLIEAPKVAKKLAEVKKGLIPRKATTAEQWAKELTAQERMAMNMWQGTSYGEIRAYEGAGKIGSVATKDMTRLFHETLDKAPKYKGTVHRGIYDLGDDAYDAIKQAACEKGGMTFDASTSTSISKKIAQGFGEEGTTGHTVMFRIKAKTGVDIDGASQKAFLREQEVILRKGTQYRVTSLKELGEVGEVPGVQWTEIMLEEI